MTVTMTTAIADPARDLVRNLEQAARAAQEAAVLEVRAQQLHAERREVSRQALAKRALAAAYRQRVEAAKALSHAEQRVTAADGELAQAVEVAQDFARRELQARQAAETAADALKGAADAGADPAELNELEHKRDIAGARAQVESQALATAEAEVACARSRLSTVRSRAREAQATLSNASKVVDSPPAVELPEDHWTRVSRDLAETWARQGVGLGRG